MTKCLDKMLILMLERRDGTFEIVYMSIRIPYAVVFMYVQYVCMLN